jgi:hypothetical protein
MKNKLTSFSSQGTEAFHDYGNVYELEETKSSERLKIAASTNQVGLLIHLIENLTPPFFILYVLVVSRLGNEYGRYQSPLLETKEEIINFLLDFKEFLETDGRHHLWIGTSSNNGTLVVDQHNVIYGYGPISRLKKTLNELEFKEESFDFPAPHVHHYHDSNDKFERDIMDYWEWYRFPLEENDEYE